MRQSTALRRFQRFKKTHGFADFFQEVENIGYEVKTVKRTITFKPQFIINEETFEHTSKLDEDFSIMQEEFKEYLKRQELEIKNAFNLDKF